MEDGQRAVGILVHPDRGLDVVAAMAVGGELQEPALSREDGYNAAKQQLTAHPDTTIWLSYSNDNMKGVYKALTDAGVANDDPSYFLAGMDVTNEDLDLIQLPNSIYPKSGSWVRAGLRKTLVDWGDERIERGPRGSPCG